MTDETNQNLERLYRACSAAFPHPLDWVVLLENEPFWFQWRERRARKKLTKIFVDHGFSLTRYETYRFNHWLGSWQYYGLDCGGFLIERLRWTLQSQLNQNP